MARGDLSGKILKLFREQPAGFVSGALLSRELGVTRAAIWKQVERLRQRGYQIEAVSSKGYQLLETPDLFVADELAADLGNTRIGRQLVCFEDTDSTNVQARRLAEDGCADGTVVIADRQTAGRGRLGRGWVSPAGVNFYGSIVLRPPIPAVEASQLTFLSAVATREAIAACGALLPTMKWPNDILLLGRKVAGLLNELDAETERVNFVILGIGVNLNMTADQFPADLRYPATSVLLETGTPVLRLTFARRLLQRLDHWYQHYLQDGFEPVLRAWEEGCDLVGSEVEVDCRGILRRGTVTGLDSDGALLLRTAASPRERILAGDVRRLS
ncbi:MAG: biotin--[acetyl-CoA-carboxylase] ligase [Desulfuromonadales bacterium]|nr:biotin--[acetyl-CoA-carboxylase] ligase [Desulfuromonadales bacterium]